MIKAWPLLIFSLVFFACDRTSQNRELIKGEWVVDSHTFQAPSPYLPLDAPVSQGTRFVFDQKNRVGIFAEDSIKNPKVYYYSVSNKKLILWVSDMGVPMAIDQLTEKRLVLINELAGIPSQQKILLLRAE